MTAAILQTTTTTLNGGQSSIAATFALALTPGSTLVAYIWVAQNFSNVKAVGVNDGSPFVFTGDFLHTAHTMESWLLVDQPSAAGGVTVTATADVGGWNFVSMVCYEVGGVKVAPLDGHTVGEQTNPGTGANGVTLGPPAPNNTNPGIVVAATLSKDGDTGIAAGTGFTASTGWGNFGGGNNGLSESLVVLTPSPAVTFTAALGTGDYDTIEVILDSLPSTLDFQANIVGHAVVTPILSVASMFTDFQAAIVGHATVTAAFTLTPASPTQAVLDYTATIRGFAGGKVAAAMDPSVVPLPLDFLFSIGVRRISDVVTGPSGGPPATVVRTVTLGLEPTVLPTATLTREQGSQAGPLTSVTLTNRGQNLTRAPIWEVTETSTVPSGSLEGDTVAPIRNAILDSTLRAHSVAVVLQGSGYSPTPTLTPIGGVVANAGTPMKLHAVVVGGHITSVVIDDPGTGYFSPPTSILITDPDGSGAVLEIPNMEIDAITIVDPGDGYVSPVVTAVPFFKFTWPDSIGEAAQEEPFFDLITNGLQSSASTPITAAEPVLS